MEKIIESAGTFGLFQVLLFVIKTFSMLIAVNSTMFMSFGGYNPGWSCEDVFYNDTSIINETINGTGTSYNASNENTSISASLLLRTNSTLEQLESADVDQCDLWRKCSSVVYSTESSTIVSEWDLVCDNAWIPSFMITIQMIGFLVGSFIGGWVGERFGRKIGLYVNVGLNCVLAFVSVFSNSWQMFTVFRFLIGLAVGGVLTCIYYPMEFINNWWRPVVASLPLWGIGTIVLSLICFLLPNWQYIHVVNGIMSAMVLLTALWMPESIRWLAVRGKSDQVKVIVRRMTKANNSDSVDDEVIENYITNEIFKDQQDASRKPTYADLFKTIKLRKYSLKFGFAWLIMAIVYFMISFGIRSFSGNFYLNMILFALSEIPGSIIVAPLANRFGRRVTSLLFYLAMALSSLGIVVAQLSVDSSTKADVANTITVWLAIFCKCATVGVWSTVSLMSTELYPTVVRNLHSGYLSALACFGGIVAPFMISSESSDMYVIYSICAGLILVAAVLMFSVSESKGKPLTDTIGQTTVTRAAPYNVDDVKFEAIRTSDSDEL